MSDAQYELSLKLAAAATGTNKPRHQKYTFKAELQRESGLDWFDGLELNHYGRHSSRVQPTMSVQFSSVHYARSGALPQQRARAALRAAAAGERRVRANAARLLCAAGSTATSCRDFRRRGALPPACERRGQVPAAVPCHHRRSQHRRRTSTRHRRRTSTRPRRRTSMQHRQRVRPADARGEERAVDERRRRRGPPGGAQRYDSSRVVS